jgi:uncharacterized membrane protein YphA (DoxX/SURF4 family)
VDRFFDKPDFGKLIIRVILGLIFAWYGVKMLGGGRSAIVVLDRPFTFLSVTLSPKTWIFLVSIFYLIAGILFMAGSFFKSCCITLTAIEFILIRQSIFAKPEEIDLMLLHVVLAAVCLGFLFIHPGKFSANS